MKILGIGVDVIQNKRVKSLINNKSFINRTFGKNELKNAKKFSDKTNYFAKRFAAKESLAKSLGTGFRIEILNDEIGKPYFSKSKKINNIIIKKFKVRKYDLFLSITDEKEYSVAFTILQSK